MDHHGTAQDLAGVEARGHGHAHVVAAAAAGVVPGRRRPATFVENMEILVWFKH